LAKEENISVLCEELELNLENIKPEAAAGRYNVDLVADDIDTKRKVIIAIPVSFIDYVFNCSFISVWFYNAP
jgi:hypothetical protein